MEEPDYTTHRIEELYDIRGYIDRERFPDRFARLEKEIARREAELEVSRSVSSQSPIEDSQKNQSKSWAIPVIGCGVIAHAAALLILVSLIFGIFDYFTTEEIAGAFSSSAVINNALNQKYPSEEVSATLTLSTNIGRTVTVTLTNSQLSNLPEAQRREAEREIAATAFYSDPDRDDLSGVDVILRKELILIFALYTDDRDSFSFDPQELHDPASASAIHEFDEPGT